MLLWLWSPLIPKDAFTIPMATMGKPLHGPAQSIQISEVIALLGLVEAVSPTTLKFGHAIPLASLLLGIV